MQYIAIFILTSMSLFAKPPEQMPPHLRDAYTLNGQVPVSTWYLDGTTNPERHLAYNEAQIEELVKNAKNKKTWYYGAMDTFLYEAIETYVGNFEGKTVGVMGSVRPWYEAIVLAYNGKPITIDYFKPNYQHPDITLMTVDEYNQNPIQFDYIFSLSSFEHDGLGRYGDPLDPSGDLRAMRECKSMLKKGGLLFLAVPVGPDLIVWNAHRIYGKIRLPMLLKDWDLIGSVGFSETYLTKKGNGIQPVFVLAHPA